VAARKLRAEQHADAGQAGGHFGGRIAAKPVHDEVSISLIFSSRPVTAFRELGHQAHHQLFTGSMTLWAAAARTAVPPALRAARTLRARSHASRLGTACRSTAGTGSRSAESAALVGEVEDAFQRRADGQQQS